MANVVIVDVPVTFHAFEAEELGIYGFEYPDNPLPGTVVGTLFNVPNGAVPEVLPEKYFKIEGDEVQGWKVTIRTPLRENQPISLIVTAGRNRLVGGLNLYENVLLLSPVTGEFLLSPVDGNYLESPVNGDEEEIVNPSLRTLFWANPFWQRILFWSNHD